MEGKTGTADDDDEEDDGSITSSSLSREQLKSLDSTPVVSLDYWFAATRHNQQSQATILTIVDHNSGFVDAISCSKGSHEGAVTFVKAFLRQVGHVKCILQSDAEASTTALTRTVAAQLQNVFVRVAARGSHGSQGVIESKIRVVQSQLRTVLGEFENNTKVAVGVHSPIFQWILRHTVFLLNRFSSNSDNISPYEAVLGKTYVVD